MHEIFSSAGCDVHRDQAVSGDLTQRYPDATPGGTLGALGTLHDDCMTSLVSGSSLSLAVLAGGLAAAGCLADSIGDPEESSATDEIQIDNGKSLNGISLNGTTLNGKSLNGKSLNGISLNGISLSGVSLTGVSVSNTLLRGTKSGATVSGAQLVGATMKGQMTDSSLVDLRIDASTTLAAPNTDVRVYTITYSTTAGWQPLCTDPTLGNQAILFPGTWNLTTVKHQADANLFTVGCRGATFAKCEELGYKGDSRIDTYLETCIRALRADYCGDGVGHAVDGTVINIYDNLGIQADTQAWSVESNWTPDGAICINKGRIATSLVEPAVPACMASRAKVPCVTSSWPSGVLIRTEVNK